MLRPHGLGSDLPPARSWPGAPARLSGPVRSESIIRRAEGICQWMTPSIVAYSPGDDRASRWGVSAGEQLVNDVSIVQCEAVERVAYFHVELDSHDVIVTGSRELCRLRQPADVLQRRRVRRSLSRRGSAALGLLRAASRRRPEGRGGVAAARPTRRNHGRDWPLQGWLDTAEAGLVRGWARDAANSDMPAPVELVVDGV